MSERVLEVNNLHVSFDITAGEVQAVRGVDFFLNKGETFISSSITDTLSSS